MKTPFRLVATLLALYLPLSVAAEENPLVFGVLPHLGTVSPRYSALRAHLAQRLRRPVALVSAPDFETFVARTQRGEYDFVVTAPHGARLAQRAAGYTPLLKPQRAAVAVLVADNTGAVANLADVRGREVAFPSLLALASLQAKQLLRDAGLEAGRDYTARDSGLHIAAARAVIAGSAAAAATSLSTLQRMPQEVQQRLRILAQAPPLPEAIYLAHSRVPAQTLLAFRQAVLDFSQSEVGKMRAQISGSAGFEAPGDAELEALDPYADELARALESF